MKVRATKIPKWESLLWSFVSSGDGMHCPFYSHCRMRLICPCCADDKKEKFSQLIEGGSQFNPDDYDFIKPCNGRIIPFVEKLARKQLGKASIRCIPVPTEIISLADDQHPIEVRLVPLTVHRGAIWRLSDSWVIHLNSHDPPARRRLSLFHEAFHILAHCNSKATPLFRKIGANQGSFNELLADFYAIHVLMPKKAVKEKWAEIKDVDRMASTFDVPKVVMWIRLRRLGLV